MASPPTKKVIWPSEPAQYVLSPEGPEAADTPPNAFHGSPLSNAKPKPIIKIPFGTAARQRQIFGNIILSEDGRRVLQFEDKKAEAPGPRALYRTCRPGGPFPDRY